MSAKREVSLKDAPVRVQRVHINGLGRTKDDFVSKQVQPIFGADNFEQLADVVEETRMKMERLGLFKKVGVFVDVAKGPDARPDGYEITYTVTEPRILTGGVSGLVGTNDGSLLGTLSLPNTFGRAERVTAEWTKGTNASSGSLTFRKPLWGNPDITLNAGGFKYCGEYPWSGYKETDRGVGVELAFPTVLGGHSVRWEGVWRDLGCLSNSTSFAVREQAGHSLKSSLKHILVRDKRDDHILPTEGYMLRVIQEVAGLGGDVSFLKHEEEFQLNKSLLFGTSFQASLSCGVAKSMRPEEPLRINDKYFLGGPLSLRGFNIKGAGPHTDGNALGADTYWIAGLHLYTPLPFMTRHGGFADLFRTHFFLNAGNLANLDFSDRWRHNAQKLVDETRVSCGGGVVLKLGGIARVELNYCVPIRSQPCDSVARGVQFGIGINFV